MSIWIFLPNCLDTNSVLKIGILINALSTNGPFLTLNHTGISLFVVFTMYSRINNAIPQKRTQAELTCLRLLDYSDSAVLPNGESDNMMEPTVLTIKIHCIFTMILAHDSMNTL